MTMRIFSTLVYVAALSTFSIPQTSSDSRSAAQRYIAESESQWAAAVASGDTAVIERILADDFVGVDTDGSHYNKAKAVTDTREAPKEFLSNRLNEVQIRFYGMPPSPRATKVGSGAVKFQDAAASYGPIPGFAATANGRSSPPKT